MAGAKALSLGRGLSFPPRIEGGRLAWSADEDNIRESIRVILMTEPGERIMRPRFGAGLREFLFEPNTPATRTLIRDRIAASIARWEARVTLDEVRVEPDPEEARRIVVTIVYRLVATGQTDRMNAAFTLGSERVADEAPNLAAQDFEQLLTEAKRRIPVHTPEWTNFEGESDPGITLVQLFAFLTESLIYTANRVPERNRLRFLQLLDVRPAAPTPAEGLVTWRFAGAATDPVTIAAGLELKAGSIPFVMREGVTCLPVESKVFYKRPIPVGSEQDTDLRAQYQTMIAALAAAGSEGARPLLDEAVLYETVPLPATISGSPWPAIDLRADTADTSLHIALLAAKPEDVEIVRESIAARTVCLGVAPGSAAVEMPLLPGRTLGPRLPDPIVEVLDAVSGAYRRLKPAAMPNVFVAPGVLQLELPEAGVLGVPDFAEPFDEGGRDLPPKVEDEKVRARIVGWLRLRAPSLGSETSSLGMSIAWAGVNAAPIVQAKIINDERLGVSSGVSDQRFAASVTPIVESSVLLEVLEEGRWSPWRLSDQLFAAGPDDRAASINTATGEVMFGDGVHGRVPPRGSTVRISYRTGSGASGNVAAGAVAGKAKGVVTAEASNPLPTWGGAAGESVDQAQRRVPAILRHRDRLVSKADIEEITRRIPGVGRAEAIPLMRPGTAGDTPGAITVLVVPSWDARRPLWPAPDRLFLGSICRHLDPRRLITTELHVRGPDYIPLRCSLGIRVRPGHLRDEVIDRVGKAVSAFLSALPPGGPSQEGWPLARPVRKREIEAVADRVEGVEFVQSSILTGPAGASVEEAAMDGLRLPLLASVDVREGSALPPTDAPASQDGPLTPIPVIRSKC